MLARPQEGNEVVLLMGLWICLIDKLVALVVMVPQKESIRQMHVQFYLYAEMVASILKVASLVVMSKLQLRGAPQLESALRRRRQLQLWAVLVAYLSINAYCISREPSILTIEQQGAGPFLLLALLVDIASMAVAVLLLNLRPRCIANRTSSPHARKLVSVAKLVSALCLAAFLILSDRISVPLSSGFAYLRFFNQPIARVVLSLGSLQRRSPAMSPANRGIDVIMHVFFLLFLVVVPIPPFFLISYWAHVSTPSIAAISSSVILAALLVGNLQIPVAVVQVVLSSWQLHGLQAHKDYYRLLVEAGSAVNLVPAMAIFYLLALCQGALYTMACVIGLCSFIPRRSLVRSSNFSGRRGAKAVDLYYQEAYTARMKIGVLSSGNRISLASFAMDSLCSGSRETELAGVVVLDSLLQQNQPSRELIPRIASSYKEVSTLIAMLGWTAKQDRDIRLFAARVTAKLAGSVRIATFPGMINMVSSLLDAEIQPAEQVPGMHGGGCCSSWVRQCWRRMKENWSLPKDPPSSHQDLLPVLGMVILEELAHDHDNCAEIFKATNLISKAVGLVSYRTYNTNDGNREEEQQIAVIRSSLNFVRRLSITGDKIGVALRQELWNHPFLLNNLTGVLEDTRSDSRLRKPAMDIIAKLALDEIAGKEIGRTKVITGNLMHAFFARCGPANMNDEQSLPMAAGEALANLAMWGTENCSAILEEPGYEVIKDLNSMLCEDECRHVAANLLHDLCGHCRVKLMDLPYAREHLSSALTIVMEHIEAAEGKQLESLIVLASEIADIIHEAFVHKLESQTNNGAGLVQKLVGTLNSANRKPNPEYPRMRRSIVKIVITTLESCHRTVEMVGEGVMEGLMEALIKIERTPSKVEKYRVFYGNIGAVLESGEPMPALVARAKALIRPATQPAAGR